jgi:ribonuclease-3
MDPELLAQAFTHTSYAREMSLPQVGSNQRLEFLGDAVLDLILAEHLYLTHPDISEGKLTKLKAAAVRSESLARIARQIGLGQYLLLGRGEADTGGREKPSLLADAFEALVGAVYLSVGYKAASDFVLGCCEALIVEVEAQHEVFDYKTSLQELLQEHTKQTPTYETVETLGPPHDRTFVVEVRYSANTIGRGEGPSKQAAQQSAAHAALAEQPTWLPKIVKAARRTPNNGDHASEGK